MLDIMLALDRASDVVKALEIDQPLQSVVPRKAFDKSRTMLEDAAHEIVSHADVENTVFNDLSENR